MTLPQIVETLVTAAEDPLDSEGIAAAIRNSVALRAAELAEGESLPDHLAPFAETTAAEVEDAITALNQAYLDHGHALSVVLRPRGWQLMTRPEFADFLASLFPERRSHRLSGPALETLAIIAYRQPVTKGEIESVRGVSADGMLQKLLDLELVKIGGRAEVPGRPLQYVTTGKFLEHFNLRSPEELPNSQELRRINLPTAAEVHGTPDLPLTSPDTETTTADAGESTDAPATTECTEEPPGQAEISLPLPSPSDQPDPSDPPSPSDQPDPSDQSDPSDPSDPSDQPDPPTP